MSERLTTGVMKILRRLSLKERKVSQQNVIEYLSQNWVGQLGIKFRTLTIIMH